MLVLRNCNFVEELTEQTNLSFGDLIIEDKRIVEIVPPGASVPENCDEKNMNGATVIPGLINAHVHLFMIQDLDYFMKYDSKPKKTLDCLKFSDFLLKNGYTTVRDCGEDESSPVAAIRDWVNSGEIQGPNLITCGKIISPPDRGFEPFDWMTEFIYNPSDVRKAARVNFKNGADFVKLYGTGSMFTEGSVPGR